jgi:hypothetical protein
MLARNAFLLGPLLLSETDQRQGCFELPLSVGADLTHYPSIRKGYV